MMEKMRILVVDDYPVMREGLTALINYQKDMQVCGQAQNGEEALLLFREHQPDLVLMDLHMPVMNGVQATRYICQEFPDACILGFTSFAEEELASLLQAGARGHLLKDAPLADILSAIRTAIPTRQTAAVS